VASLQGVEFGYEPDMPVIRSVTVGLTPGRVCALIGPNASGKSTLLKLILGQLAPSAGSVEVVCRSVASLSFRQRAALVSYVPQRGVMSFAFTVRQVVAMGRYALGHAAGAVEHALEVCDLTGLADRVYAHLSGGQQQRVMLARAVAQSAGAGRVMLLDEPASGMDLKHIHQTMRLLKRIAHGKGAGAGEGDLPGGGAGPGVLVVLHDVNLASRYADDVWLLDEGELVAAGPCRDVMRPKRLASVYGVGFKQMQAPDTTDPGAGTESGERPVFWIDPGDTMD
jgi:ABC-type cobalamin/Fe3+-siderophores transport system ATPase subunit